MASVEPLTDVAVATPSVGVTSVGEVSVRPAMVEAVPPRLTAVDPMVTLEFVSAAFPMFVTVFAEPLMLLLVRVSVEARPTRVSVAAGSVNEAEACWTKF
jgi:hypothetical protein